MESQENQQETVKKVESRKTLASRVLSVHFARRISQGLFLALFLLLLCKTTFRGSFSASPETIESAPWAVDWFLHFDPYISLITFLSTWKVYKALALSVFVVLLTIVFGRVFCGWVCPLGTLNQLAGWLRPSRAGRGSRRIDANTASTRRQNVKYYVLFASLGAAMFGSAIGGIFDPISFLIRSVGLSVMPALQYVDGLFTEWTSRSSFFPLVLFGDGLHYVFSHFVWQSKQFYYYGGWVFGVLLVAVLFMNRVVPRFWCRVLCPLGAMLGVLSRFSLVGLQKDKTRCNNCSLCLLHCQGASSPQGGSQWLQHECHMCLNCVEKCQTKALEMRFLPSRSDTRVSPDLSKRTTLASTAAGLAVIPFLRASGSAPANFDRNRIRPPGSVDEREFLDRCVRCGACMKVCPNNAIHPAMGVGGVEAVWTPIIIPHIGYCEPSCVLCSQVCPTGAINRHLEGVGGGSAHAEPVKIGTAFYDHGRCLPWAMQIPCIVCEEFCPTSPKAIWVEEVEVPFREVRRADEEEAVDTSMKLVKLKRPHVDPSACLGCGACEKACPVVDEPAIRVSSVGEARSKTNVIVL